MSPAKAPPATDQSELTDQVLRAGHVAGLLFLLAVLYLVIARSTIDYPGSYLAALGVFGLVVLVFRYTRLLDDSPALKLSCHATVMVVFISSLIAVSGTYAAPLLNLYLLPVIGIALTLGRAAAFFQILLMVVCRLVLTLFIGDGTEPLNYVLNLTVELAPIVLAALLITNLASDVRTAESRVQDAADRDALTGLMNMQGFARLAEAEYERAKRRGSEFGVLMVDIDGLSSVNEKFGPEGGNRTLVAVADALVRSIRHLDFIARYGGDKFVVYLDGASESVAEAVRNRIRHNVFATTLDIHHNLSRTSVTVGIACFPKDGKDLWSLVDNAGRDVNRERELRRSAVEREHRVKAEEYD